jgi:hypothetical protein
MKSKDYRRVFEKHTISGVVAHGREIEMAQEQLRKHPQGFIGKEDTSSLQPLLFFSALSTGEIAISIVTRSAHRIASSAFHTV